MAAPNFKIGSIMRSFFYKTIFYFFFFMFVFVTDSSAKKQKWMYVDGKPALKKLFIKTGSCTPVLSWDELRKDPANETYDVSLYYALFKSMGSSPPDLGQQVFSLENINDRAVKLVKPLDPKTRYLWSVRIRNTVDGTVSNWLVHDVSQQFLTLVTFYSNVWPGLKTPSKCTK